MIKRWVRRWLGIEHLIYDDRIQPSGRTAPVTAVNIAFVPDRREAHTSVARLDGSFTNEVRKY